MKMNNKGMTLIELLVTIVFVGIVLVFMFSMLNGLKNETDNNNFAYNNQVNKIDAIHMIQKDLNTYNLKYVKSNSNSEINVTFGFEDPSSPLNSSTTKEAILKVTRTNKNGKVDKVYLNYKGFDGKDNKWEMKGADIDSCGKFIIYKERASDGNPESNNYFFLLKLFVYNLSYNEQNNKSNNNVIDDIEVSYAGYNYYLENNYLTGGGEGYHEYNIGKCS